MVRMNMLVVTLASGGAVIAATAASSRLKHGLRLRLAVAMLVAYAAVLIAQPPSLLASNLAVLLAAVAAGTLIGRSLGQRGAIVAFCITIAVVDLFSFGGGLTRTIIDNYREGSSNLLVYLVVTVRTQGQTIPVVGVGDLLMLSALYLGLRGIGRPGGQVVALLLGSLGVALVVGLIWGGAPALPFLAAAVIGFLTLGEDRGDPR
jgi:hypothetical protein